MTKKTIVSIGIDLGLTMTGVCILKNNRVVHWFTRSNTDTKIHIGSRVRLLVKETIDEINSYIKKKKITHVHVVVLETPYFNRINAKSYAFQSRLLQEFSSIIVSSLECSSLLEVTPTEIKALFGKAHANKKELKPKVLEKISFPSSFHKLLDNLELQKPVDKLKTTNTVEAIIDAAAIAYYGKWYLEGNNA